MLLKVSAFADTSLQKKTGSITISASNNVELLITDSLGRRVGKNPFTNKTYNEIPNTFYGEESGIADADVADGKDDSTEPTKSFQDMKAPLETTYKVEIYSEKGGSYDVTAYLFGSSGEAIGVEKKNGKISAKGKELMTFKYSEKKEATSAPKSKK